MTIYVIIDLFNNMQITEEGGGVGYYHSKASAASTLGHYKRKYKDSWRFYYEQYIEKSGTFRYVNIMSFYKVMTTDEWRQRGKAYEGMSCPKHPDYDARYWKDLPITHGVPEEHLNKVVKDVVIEKDIPHFILEDGTKVRGRGTYCY